MDNRTKWRKNNPIKARAHYAVQNSIKKGLIITKSCEICGNKAHAHHDDYSKQLEIRWLCNKHHKEWHLKNEPIIPNDINLEIRRHNKPSENILIPQAKEMRTNGMKYKDICKELGYPHGTIYRWVNYEQ